MADRCLTPNDVRFWKKWLPCEGVGATPAISVSTMHATPQILDHETGMPDLGLLVPHLPGPIRMYGVREMFSPSASSSTCVAMRLRMLRCARACRVIGEAHLLGNQLRVVARKLCRIDKDNVANVAVAAVAEGQGAVDDAVRLRGACTTVSASRKIKSKGKSKDKKRTAKFTMTRGTNTLASVRVRSSSREHKYIAKRERNRT